MGSSFKKHERYPDLRSSDGGLESDKSSDPAAAARISLCCDSRTRYRLLVKAGRRMSVFQGSLNISYLLG